MYPIDDPSSMEHPLDLRYDINHLLRYFCIINVFILIDQTLCEVLIIVDLVGSSFDQLISGLICHNQSLSSMDHHDFAWILSQIFNVSTYMMLASFSLHLLACWGAFPEHLLLIFIKILFTIPHTERSTLYNKLSELQDKWGHMGTH